MNRPGRFAVVTNEDSYRHTEPIGRPFDGRVPRYRDERDPGAGWPPPSYPYPYANERRPVQPIPARIVGDHRPTPPEPVAPPEPFIANLATAKNTNKIYRELVWIRWLLIVIILLIGVMLFCEITMSARLSTILPFSPAS